MATMTITQVLGHLTGLKRNLGNKAAEIMTQRLKETTHGPGDPVHLYETIKVEERANDTVAITTNKYVGGGKYGIREVGAIIRKGRKELWPRYSRVLEFPPPPGWDGPIDKKTGMAVAHHASKADPNDFVEYTMQKIREEIAAKGIRAGS